MQKILRRRTLRELKDSWLRSLILGMLITVAVFMIVSLLGAAETVIRGVRDHDSLNKMEDGQFQTFSVLSGDQEEEIRNRGVILERQFYMDFELPDGSCVRIFRNREEIDLLELLDGEEAREKNEIVLERRYCEVHDLTVGDEVTFAGHLFRITGIGTVPDYNSPMKGMTDSIVDSKQFGPGFVSGDCYEELRAGGNAAQAETYVYSFRLPEGMEGKELRKLIESFPFRVRDIKDPYFQQYYREQTESVSLLLDLVDSFLFDEEDAEDFRRAMEPEIHNLQQFVMAEDNLRIDAAQDDVMINLYGSLLAGVIILALFAYVMTVFILHGIDEDSAVIGALYAMGVKRQELMHHYILLPTIVSFFSGIAGTVLGHTAAGIRYQMMDTYLYYSVPDLPVRPIPYIIVYGVVLPPLIAALVSCLSIRSRLKRSALSLLRKEKKQVRVSNIGFERSPFTARFSMKQTMREIRSVLTVVAGLFICLVLVWIGIDCWVMCGHIRVDNEADTKYEYMYLYKYPEKTAPEGGIAGYAEGFSKERFGYDLDVTLLGMPEDNPYFEVTTGDAQNAVSVSSAMAQKYALSEGDVFTVEDKASERLYAFRVQSVFQYSPGFFAVMEIGAMRDLMGQPDDYYNAVFSDRELPVPGGRLYSTVTKDQIRKSGDVFINLMWSMIYFMVGLSSLISLAVMYLMLGVMVDHSAYDISMMKIIGYTDKEIRKMYLSGNFFLIAIGAVPAIALSKITIDALYPLMISNVACGMDLRMTPLVYAGIYVFIVGSCFLITLALTGRVRRIRPAEVLKNAE